MLNKCMLYLWNKILRYTLPSIEKGITILNKIIDIIFKDRRWR